MFNVIHNVYSYTQNQARAGLARTSGCIGPISLYGTTSEVSCGAGSPAWPPGRARIDASHALSLSTSYKGAKLAVGALSPYEWRMGKDKKSKIFCSCSGSLNWQKLYIALHPNHDPAATLFQAFRGKGYSNVHCDVRFVGALLLLLSPVHS